VRLASTIENAKSGDVFEAPIEMTAKIAKYFETFFKK
jgi:hypothetical protein